MAELEDVLTKLREERGIDLTQYKPRFVRRRLEARMKLCGIGTWDEYLGYLESHPEEYDEILKRLSISVTEFFRNPRVWSVFEKKVLPQLWEKKRLRFWCAGVATGEEAYTLAMILRKSEMRFGERDISITATDVDTGALRHARRGVYQSIKGVPRYYLRFFEEDEHYRVKKEIRQMVHFCTHNLLTGRQFRFFDVVICRNVIIYFSRDEQVSVLKRFHTALNPGGILVLGRTEAIIGPGRGYFSALYAREKIYQKC